MPPPRSPGRRRVCLDGRLLNAHAGVSKGTRAAYSAGDNPDGGAGEFRAGASQPGGAERPFRQRCRSRTVFAIWS
jgi:hypothetical protein